MVIDCDTTRDVMHKEPLSISVRIVDDVGDCSEHLLSYQSASGTSAVALYNTIVTPFETRGMTVDTRQPGSSSRYHSILCSIPTACIQCR